MEEIVELKRTATQFILITKSGLEITLSRNIVQLFVQGLMSNDNASLKFGGCATCTVKKND